jgi:hypothetical protein
VRRSKQLEQLERFARPETRSTPNELPTTTTSEVRQTATEGVVPTIHQEDQCQRRSGPCCSDLLRSNPPTNALTDTSMNESTERNGNVSALASSSERLAQKWTDEAARRREVSAHDVSADVFLYCATALLETIKTASADDEPLSPAEFGALSHVNKSASQVRRWCQLGQIECDKVGRDYRIRRGAKLPAFAGGVAA